MLNLENVKSVFRTSPLAGLILHPDSPLFTIAWANPACLLLAEVEPEDLEGKSIIEILGDTPAMGSQPGAEGLKNALNRTLNLKTAQIAGVQSYKRLVPEEADQEVRFWGCNSYPLLDEQGKVLFIVLNLEDTSKNLIESYPVNALLTRKHIEHPLFEDYPDAIFTLNSAGQFLSANRILLEIAGCSFEDLSKLSFVSFIAPVDLERVLENFKRAIAGEVLNFDAEISSIKGEVRHLNITHLPILFNQEVTGIYVIAKDITANVKSQQELLLHHTKVDTYYKKISNILESITDGFYAMDKDWKVTYWNKEAERILQRPREAIIGKTLWDVYPAETHEVLFAAYRKALSRNLSVHLEMHYAPLNAWMEVSVFPLEDGLSVFFRDITTRKHIEKNLKEAKKQYQELFDLSPLPQWVYNTEDYTFQDVNQAAIAHYGYSKEEFLAMTIKEIRPREDLEYFLKTMNKDVKEGMFHKMVARHLKKNGEIIDVQVEGNPILYQGESARLVLAVDITEKSRAQQALIASERKFKALVQDGLDILAILDKAGNYLYVNHTSERILKMSPESFIGRNALDYLHDEDKKRFLSEYRLVATEKSIRIAPFRFKNGDGEFRWIETTVTDMTEDPAVRGIVANSRDVTERMQIEQKIQQSIERYNIVSKATSDAIWDFDLTTGLVTWNEASKSLFGHQECILTPDWWENNVHPEDVDRVMLNIKAFVGNKNNRMELEYRFRCADGSYKIVLDRSSLMFNEQGELVRIIGSMQDITERVMYVQTVDAQNKRFKEIAWTQSHVVRAPLARIIGLVDLLQYASGLNDTDMQLLNYLTESAVELDTIIQDISRKTELIITAQGR